MIAKLKENNTKIHTNLNGKKPKEDERQCKASIELGK